MGHLAGPGIFFLLHLLLASLHGQPAIEWRRSNSFSLQIYHALDRCPLWVCNCLPNWFPQRSLFFSLSLTLLPISSPPFFFGMKKNYGQGCIDRYSGKGIQGQLIRSSWLRKRQKRDTKGGIGTSVETLDCATLNFPTARLTLSLIWRLKIRRTTSLKNSPIFMLPNCERADRQRQQPNINNSCVYKKTWLSICVHVFCPVTSCKIANFAARRQRFRSPMISSNLISQIRGKHTATPSPSLHMLLST